MFSEISIRFYKKKFFYVNNNKKKKNGLENQILIELWCGVILINTDFITIKLCYVNYILSKSVAIRYVVYVVCILYTHIHFIIIQWIFGRYIYVHSESLMTNSYYRIAGLR